MEAFFSVMHSQCLKTADLDFFRLPLKNNGVFRFMFRCGVFMTLLEADDHGDQYLGSALSIHDDCCLFEIAKYNTMVHEDNMHAKI